MMLVDPKRLLALAEEPAPRLGFRAAVQAKRLVDSPEGRPAAPRRVDARDAVIVPLMARRVRRADDAARLQASYVADQRRYAARNPGSQRLGLVDAAVPDGSGALTVTMTGVLADWHQHALNDQVDRVLLATPTAWREDGSPVVVDSHVWLRADRLTGVESHPLVLHAGETILLVARLHAYRDAHGNRRLGLGEWTPTRAALRYGLRVDGRVGARTVPPALVHRFELARIDPDGMTSWADAPALDAEYERFRPAPGHALVVDAPASVF